MYKIIITDYNGKHIEVEVSKEVHQAFIDLRKTETKMRNEQHRKWDMRGFDSFLSNQARYASNSIVDEILIREDEKETEIQMERLLNKIYFILDQCTPKQKERFLLYAVQGFTIQQIADFQQCNKSSVSRSVQKVLNILRKTLVEGVQQNDCF